MDSEGQTVRLSDWWEETEFGFLSTNSSYPPPPGIPGVELGLELSESESETIRTLQQKHQILRIVDIDAKTFGFGEPGLWRPDQLFLYSKLTALSPVPVFISGPHNDTQLISSRSDYGKYNPEFLRWTEELLSQLWEDSDLVALTKPLFPTHLRDTALVYWDIASAFIDNEDALNALAEDYHNKIAKGLPFWQISEEANLDQYPFFNKLSLSKESDLRLIVYFWVRRFSDGSGSKFYSMLTNCLNAYGFLNADRVSKLSTKASSK